jgi:hypothetical protein
VKALVLVLESATEQVSESAVETERASEQGWVQA